ncbi:MAG TPA: SusD/RagB family nutrient-binding outer membrane lipoprotein [Saprospiraceae bacterium]|nr:SusD/RagB family nutrient-binding outer membrane lipoprotein [Saprospiraceae bacterium]
MKSIIKVCMITLTCWLVSCDNLSEINIDPNNPSSARPQEVLTSAEGYITFIMDSQFNDNAFLWGQYWTWGPGVSLGDVARYIQLPTEGNQAWARSYSDALADIKFLKKADNAGFRGMAKVLEVYVYQYLVDHFGDIPYTDAIKGAIEDGSILAPTYDDDATIYPKLVTTLDEAIVDLSSPSQAIGTEDMIYAGDLSKWIKFANSLKLRVLMRMSDVNDVSAQVIETVATGQFIESGDEIAQVAFTGASGSENPMFAWEEASIGLFYKAASTVTAVQDESADPRKFALYKEAEAFPDSIVSAYQNEIALNFTAEDKDWSDPADIAYGAAVSTILMSDWETWFLRAEAAVKFGTADDAATSFDNAIVANFDFLGVADGATYAANLGFAGNSDQGKINTIGVQKWLSMNGLQEAEGWIEARRFDTPENPIFSGTNGIYQTPIQSALPDHVFPSRWLYPESEQTLNPNARPQASITDKVFWDR